MNAFTPDEARRSNAWQQAAAVAAHRSEASVRMFGMAMFAAMLAVVIIAMLR